MTITDLELGGLSCASCAARVERGLNQLDGVRATVNFAVERAHVEHDSDVSASDLIRAVESAGYQASVRSAEPRATRRGRLFTIGVALKVGRPDEKSGPCCYGHRGAHSRPSTPKPK